MNIVTFALCVSVATSAVMLSPTAVAEATQVDPAILEG